MSGLLSSFVSRVQTKHWQNLQRRTQKLNRTEQEHLMEFLEDHLTTPSSPSPSAIGGGSSNTAGLVDGDSSNQDDIDDGDDNESSDEEEDCEVLQKDLDAAIIRLEELQSKHDFIQKRLEAYRSKIAAAEDSIAAREQDLPADRRIEMVAKIESYKQTLKPVEEAYREIASSLASHQRKIGSMQDRQLDLRLKTEECLVVLEELAAIGGDATTTTTTTAAAPPYSDDPVIVAELGRRDAADNPATTYCGLGDDELGSVDEDVENVVANGSDNVEAEQEPPSNDRQATDNANEENIELLSIPVGTHTTSK